MIKDKQRKPSSTSSRLINRVHRAYYDYGFVAHKGEVGALPLIEFSIAGMEARAALDALCKRVAKLEQEREMWMCEAVRAGGDPGAADDSGDDGYTDCGRWSSGLRIP